jgi:hypothetical protein
VGLEGGKGIVARLITALRVEAERAVGWTLVVVGALALLVTYLTVDSETTVVAQLADLVSGGLGGLLVLGVGLAALVLADLADEWHKLDRIEAAIEGCPPPLRRGLGVLRRPLLAGLAGLGIGVVVLVVAWNQAADATDPNDGFGAVAVGIAGLVAGAVALAGSTYWVLRVVRLRASRLFAPWLLADMQARAGAAVPARTALRQAPTLAAPASVLVGAGLRRFHAASCAVVTAGGPYTSMPLSAVDPDLAPCGLCLPDLPQTASSMVPAGADILEGATRR